MAWPMVTIVVSRGPNRSASKAWFSIRTGSSLRPVEPVPPEMAEAGVPGAEGVELDGYPLVTQRCDLFGHRIPAVRQHAFGDLHGQPVSRQGPLPTGSRGSRAAACRAGTVAAQDRSPAGHGPASVSPHGRRGAAMRDPSARMVPLPSATAISSSGVDCLPRRCPDLGPRLERGDRAKAVHHRQIVILERAVPDGAGQRRLDHAPAVERAGQRAVVLDHRAPAQRLGTVDRRVGRIRTPLPRPPARGRGGIPCSRCRRWPARHGRTCAPPRPGYGRRARASAPARSRAEAPRTRRRPCARPRRRCAPRRGSRVPRAPGSGRRTGGRARRSHA